MKKIISVILAVIMLSTACFGIEAEVFAASKPATTSITSISAKNNGFTVKWKKKSCTGYQVQYSTSSKFKSAKTVKINKAKTTSKTINKLKAKKKYYVRVRCYKKSGKKTLTSKWSKVKKVTTKAAAQSSKSTANGVNGAKGDAGSNGNAGGNGINGQNGQNGYNGTNGLDGKDGAAGKDGTNGKDGIGIASAVVNENGELIVTLTDGTVLNLGNISGDKGDTGDTGAAGSDGKDGRGIAKTEIVDGKLIVTYTDGTSDNLGPIAIPIAMGEDEKYKYLALTPYNNIIGGSSLNTNFDRVKVKINPEFKDTIESIYLPVYYHDLPLIQIEEEGFKQCTSLKKITISGAMDTIGKNAFYGCSSLKEVYLVASNLKTIDSFAFRNCISLETITIPKSVSSIDGSTFAGCTNLKSINFEYTGNWKQEYSDEQGNRRYNTVKFDDPEKAVDILKSTYAKGSSNYYYSYTKA